MKIFNILIALIVLKTAQSSSEYTCFYSEIGEVVCITTKTNTVINDE